MLRVRLIGLGFINGEHVLGYVNRDDARIVAVCDTDGTASAVWQAKWRLESARNYLDYQQMLAGENLDIVEILTPHHLHCEMVEACARAGVRGISVQKPMGVSLA
jgi:predicted dehydrogenase